MRYLLAALLVCSVGSAGATTFTVTKTADTADGECGADCSLREAVSAANMKDGADEIVLPAGTFALTRDEEDGEPYGGLHAADLNAGGPEALTIRGAGMTSTIIEQTLFPSFSHVLAVDSDHDALVLEDLTLKGGYEDNGACLFTRTPSTIERVTFTECHATEDGGAYRSSEVLVMRGCVFESNFAGELGGALVTFDTATISDTVFRDNDALGDGGAILSDAPLTLERVTFSGNRAGGNGGALMSYGITTATNVTFSGNQAGHVFPKSADVTPSAVLAGTGGAVYAYSPIRLVHSTLTGNGAAGGGGGVFNGFHDAPKLALEGDEPAAVELLASIVADNTPEDCLDDPFGTPVVLQVSLGHVLDSDGTCVRSATGDQTAEDVRLAALADNGGPVETHALEPGSPAIDLAGDTCAAATDPRGIARPADGDGNGSALCDVGAFELEASATTTTTTAPGGSTTTTTLSGCGGGADLRSLLCRIDGLVDATNASDDLGTQKTKLAKAAGGARKLIARGREKCAAGGAKAARKAGRDLKKAGRKLLGYQRGLTSNTAQKQLDEAVRDAFLGLVEPLIPEVKSFKGSLVCPDDASPAVAPAAAGMGRPTAAPRRPRARCG